MTADSSGIPLARHLPIVCFVTTHTTACPARCCLLCSAQALQRHRLMPYAAWQLWAAMGLAVFLAIAARAAQQDRDARAAFLQTSSECEEAACGCPYCCAQPSVKPAHHVTAYMAVGLLLPWYAAVVHVFVLAST